MRPALLAPLALQAGEMDCGPAALRALLAGFGLSTNDLPEAGADGTSIDALEAAARARGLDARQELLPAGELLRALPAIVVLRREPSGAHFVLAWRARLGLVELMDPARGRRLVTRASLAARAISYVYEASAEAVAALARARALAGAPPLPPGFARPAATPDRVRLTGALVLSTRGLLPAANPL